LLSIIDANICPPNINWDDFSKEEVECLQLNAQVSNLLTKALTPNVEALISKEYEFPEDAHLLWKAIKEKFLKITTAQDSSDADCLTKPVKHIGQAKIATSKLKKSKRHQPNEESTSQTSSLYYKNHGKCLMDKDKKKKKPKKIESEEEEEEEYDLDFDKLSMKDMIKIKSLFERIQE
jgi:hypothetical protein